MSAACCAHELNTLDLNIGLLWSLRSCPQQPGYAQVQRMLARLQEQGWTLSCQPAVE